MEKPSLEKKTRRILVCFGLFMFLETWFHYAVRLASQSQSSCLSLLSSRYYRHVVTGKKNFNLSNSKTQINKIKSYICVYSMYVHLYIYVYFRKPHSNLSTGGYADHSDPFMEMLALVFIGKSNGFHSW
jgi:hypothetical protein